MIVCILTMVAMIMLMLMMMMMMMMMMTTMMVTTMTMTTCIGETVKVEVDGIVAAEQQVAKGWHLVMIIRMMMVMMKMMMVMMRRTKRGVPKVVDHWLKAIADMMSHTLVVRIIISIGISIIIMIS